MKRVLIILAALALAVWVGLNLRQNPGVIIISVAGWRIDAPLWLCVFALALIYLFVHYTVKLMRAIAHGMSNLRNYSSTYSKQKSKMLTKKGLIALAEGHFGKAERVLVQGSGNSDNPWLNYVYAAAAASELGASERRDQYLQRAKANFPETDIAVDLTQAKLAHQHGEYGESLLVLEEILAKQPNQPLALKLMQENYMKLKQWDRLLGLLPLLRKHHVLSGNEIKVLETLVWREHLDTQTDPAAVEALWQTMPSYLKRDGEMAFVYAKHLQKSNPTEAEAVLRAAIKQQWREDLIRLYGQLKHPDPQKALTRAENWLKAHPESPSLLLALGRLCKQQELWGKAQRYFEASLALEPHPQTYAELGTLLEKMDKPEAGAEFFKKGLLLAARKIKVKRV